MKEWIEIYQLVALIMLECRIRFPFPLSVYLNFINYNYSICTKFIQTFSQLPSLPIKCSPYIVRYTFESGNIMYAVVVLSSITFRSAYCMVSLSLVRFARDLLGILGWNWAEGGFLDQ